MGGTVDPQVQEKAFEFPHGLYGFPSVKRFVIADVPGGGDLIKQMIALDHPNLAFTLVDPFGFFPAYAPDLPESELEALGASRADQVVVMAIANVPAKLEQATANLKAPVVFNPHTRKACQVILQDDRYSTRHRLFQRQ